MASTYHFFQGRANWAHVKRPNKFDNYSIDLIVDKDTKKAIKGTGLKGNAKDTLDTDEPYFTFRRKSTLRKKTGEIVEMSAPKVTLADGTEFDGLIGNGSKVTVKIEVYDFDAGKGPDGTPYNAGKGSRLEAIRIDELVEYVKPEVEETVTTGDGTVISKKDMPF